MQKFIAHCQLTQIEGGHSSMRFTALEYFNLFSRKCQLETDRAGEPTPVWSANNHYGARWLNPHSIPSPHTLPSLRSIVYGLQSTACSSTRLGLSSRLGPLWRSSSENAKRNRSRDLRPETRRGRVCCQRVLLELRR